MARFVDAHMELVHLDYKFWASHEAWKKKDEASPQWSFGTLGILNAVKTHIDFIENYAKS